MLPLAPTTSTAFVELVVLELSADACAS